MLVHTFIVLLGALLSATSILANKQPSCPLACPAVFDPVCAKDKSGNLKTFGNRCELNAANTCNRPGSPFKFVSKGECPKKCTVPCPKIYRPVCAKDSKGKLVTFSNQCLLDGANRCKKPGFPFKFVSKGRCPERCPGICTADFNPVCAKDSKGKLKTFRNQCRLDATNRCKEPGSPFKFVSKGKCPKECAVQCPKIYLPVCAKDVKGNLKTFGNQCELDAANRCKEPGSPFKFVSKGECPKKCAVPCPKIYRPVCGLSLRTNQRKTFSNACLLRAANKCKKRGYQWKLIKKGPCEKTPPCCAAILCPTNTKCVASSKRPLQCECKPILVKK